MNKREKHDLKRDWALIVVGSMLAFFLSVSANGFYDTLQSFAWKPWKLFVVFGVLSLFGAGLFGYMFEHAEDLEDDSKGFVYFVKGYIRSLFKK